MAFEFKPLIKKIEIEGKEYDLELGNYTYLVDLQKFHSEINRMDPNKANWTRIANRVVGLVTTALGKDQAKKLLDGRELHFVWISQLLQYIAEELGAEESVKAVEDYVNPLGLTIDED